MEHTELDASEQAEGNKMIQSGGRTCFTKDEDPILQNIPSCHPAQKCQQYIVKSAN